MRRFNVKLKSELTVRREHPFVVERARIQLPPQGGKGVGGGSLKGKKCSLQVGKERREILGAVKCFGELCPVMCQYPRLLLGNGRMPAVELSLVFQMLLPTQFLLLLLP